MTVLKFVKTENGIGSRVIGKLYWDEDEYDVVSGGYRKGAIPDGSYDIERYKAVAGNISTMKSGFVNPVNGRGWFLPLTPKFSTTRHGFGIHPDGNLPGTKGCVGLQGADIKKYWDKWMKTSLKNRPDSLQVSSVI
jgi:hypothetical protein